MCVQFLREMPSAGRTQRNTTGADVADPAEVCGALVQGLPAGADVRSGVWCVFN